MSDRLTNERVRDLIGMAGTAPDDQLSGSYGVDLLLANGKWAEFTMHEFASLAREVLALRERLAASVESAFKEGFQAASMIMHLAPDDDHLEWLVSDARAALTSSSDTPSEGVKGE